MSSIFARVQWVGHANLLWELHKQEVSKLNDSRRERERQHARSLANLKERLEEERERTRAAVVEEREASKAQLRAAQEVSGEKLIHTESNTVERHFICPSLFPLKLEPPPFCSRVERYGVGGRAAHVRRHWLLDTKQHGREWAPDSVSTMIALRVTIDPVCDRYALIAGAGAVGKGAPG